MVSTLLNIFTLFTEPIGYNFSVILSRPEDPDVPLVSPFPTPPSSILHSSILNSLLPLPPFPILNSLLPLPPFPILNSLLPLPPFPILHFQFPILPTPRLEVL